MVRSCFLLFSFSLLCWLLRTDAQTPPLGSTWNPAKSCQQIVAYYARNGYTFTPGVYQLFQDEYVFSKYNTYCTEDGFSLALKVDGQLATFLYNNANWDNADVYNPSALYMDDTETKTLAFALIPVQRLRIEMKMVYDQIWRNITLTDAGTSLMTLTAKTSTHTFDVPRPKSEWLALAGPQARLQQYCNFQGYARYSRTRIGFVGNNENDCGSSDSAVGVGIWQTVACGNLVTYNPSCPEGEPCLPVNAAKCKVWVSDTHYCPQLDSCGNQGTCSATGTCSCYDGYTGTYCQKCTKTAQNLWALWTFDDTLQDTTNPTTKSFTINPSGSAIAYSAGKISNAVDIPMQVYLASTIQFSSTNYFAISLWVKCTSSAPQIIFSYRNSATPAKEISAYWHTALKVKVKDGARTPIENVRDIGTNLKSNGDFVHLVVQFRRTDGFIQVVVDGVVVHNSTGFSTNYDIPNSARLYLGDSGSTASISFDQVFIFSRLLSVFEIGTLQAGEMFCCGKRSSDPTVCNGNGQCTMPDKCTCTTGSGSNCETNTCFGLSPSDSNVCSGRGNCTGFNTCVCSPSYNGINCERSIICNGILGDAGCSNMGRCVSNDTCVCNNGWSGNACQTPICSGKLATDATVCSSSGTCVAPDTCVCTPPYYGTFCERLVYNSSVFQVSTDTATFADSVVKCNAWGGNLASIRSAAENAAIKTYINKHINTATAYIGFNDISTEGKFVWEDGSPTYYINWDGGEPNNSGGNEDCTEFKGNNGKWNDNSCTTAVRRICRRPAICYGIFSNLTEVCTGYGQCIGDNTCLCQENYFGDRCHITTCFGMMSNSTSVCTGGGTCFPKDVCSCANCFDGTRCEYSYCNMSAVSYSTGSLAQSAGYINTNYNITLQYALPIPEYLRSNVNCFTTSGTEVVTATYILSNDRYICTIRSSTASVANIGLNYKGNQITNTIVSFVFLKTLQISIASTSVKAWYINDPIQVTVQTNEAVPEISKVACRLNGVVVGTLHVSSGNTFRCWVVAASASTGTIDLVYLNNPNQLFTDTTAFYFLANSTLAFDTSNTANTNIANVGQTIDSIVTATFSTLLPTALRTSIYCDFGGLVSAPFSSVYPKYTCRSTRASAGTVKLRILIDVGANVKLVITSDTLSIIFAGKVGLAATLPIVPDATSVNKSTTISLTTAAISSIPTTTDVTYMCGYSGYTGLVTASRSSNTYTCTFTNPVENTAKIEIFFVSKKLTSKYTSILNTAANLDFWGTLTINQMYPYISSFVSASSLSYQVTLTVDRTLLDPTAVRCLVSSAGDGAAYVSPSFTPVGNVVICPLTKAQLSSNTDYIDVALAVAPNQGSPFIVSNNSTFTILRGPLKLDSPLVLSTDSINLSFNVNFNTPLEKSLLFMSIEAAPTYLPGVNLPFTLPCNFSTNRATCTFPGVVSTHTVQKLDLTLVASRSQVVNITRIPMDSIYFKPNVSIISEYPFVAETADYISNGVNASFTVDSLLNPTFSYRCQITYSDSTTQMSSAFIDSSANDNVKCSIASRGIREDVTVGLEVNIAGTWLPITDRGLGNIRFTSIYLDPQLANQMVKSNHSVVESDGQLYRVPPKYATGSISLSMDSTTPSSMTCQISNSTVVCNKNVAAPLDIFATYGSILYNDTLLVKMARPLVLYKVLNLATILPRAVLRGTSRAITLRFAASALSVSLPFDYQVLCKSNISTSYSGQISTNTDMKCMVDGAHNMSSILLYPFLNISQLQSVVALSFDHQIALHYVDVGPISFVDKSITKFYYAQTNSVIGIRYSQHLPSDEIRSNVFCRLDEVTLGRYEILATTFVGSTMMNETVFNCNINADLLGKLKLTLWYKDAEAFYQLSSNHLELSFTRLYEVDRWEPLAARANVSTPLVVFSPFRTDIDFGEVKYYCEFHGLSSNGTVEKRTFDATARSGDIGAFACEIEYNQVQTVNFTILMVYNNETTRPIVDTFEFLFVDSFFLEPSYGLIKGNSWSILADYNGTDTTISFRQFPSSSFNCIRVTSGLNCSSPSMIGIASMFNSYQLYLANRTLSMRYVLYADRTISNISPRVIPVNEGTQNTLQISIDNPIALKEGSLVAYFNQGSSTLRRYEMGTFAVNTSIFNLQIANSPEETYKLTLFYKSPYVFELRNSIPFTSPYDLYFVQKRKLSFAANCSNVGYIQQALNVTITLDSPVIAPYITSGMKCKQGSSYVPTYILSSNQFICTVYSDSSKQDTLSMFYARGDSLNGDLEISNNTLDVFFVEQTSIQLVLPHATLSLNQNVTLTTTPKSINNYDDKIQYLCRYVSVSPSIFESVATRVGNHYSCGLAVTDRHTNRSVYIWVRTLDTGSEILLTTNAADFFFTDSVTLSAAYPFVRPFSSDKHIADTITMQISQFLLTSNALVCKYITSSGMLQAVAQYNSNSGSTQVGCPIDVTMQLSTENIDIELWMDIPQFSFRVSANAFRYSFFDTSLRFNQGKYVGLQSVGSTMTLSFVVPDSPNLKYSVIMQSLSSPAALQTLSCSFIPNTPASCTIANPNELHTPVQLNFTLMMSDTFSSQAANYSISHFIFYEPLLLNHSYPYLFNSYIQQPALVYFSVTKNLNWKYSVACSVNTTQGVKIFPAANLTDPGVFTCKIDSNLVQETMNVSVLVNHDLILSTNNARIHFLEDNGYTWTNQRGPTAGGTKVTLLLPSRLPSEYAGYDYQLSIFTKGKYYSLANCASSRFKGRINCTTLALPTSSALRVDIYLMINGIPSLRLSPTFSYYEFPAHFHKVLPSSYVNSNHTLGYPIVFESWYPLVNTKPAAIYATPDNSYWQNITCAIQGATQMVCPSPPHLPAGYQGPLAILVTLNGENYDRIDNALTIYDSSQIKFTSMSINRLRAARYHPNLVIEGLGFINSNLSDVSLRFTHPMIEFTYKPSCTNSTLITEVPSLFEDYSVVNYPAVFDIIMSFDGGITEVTSDLLFMTYDSLPDATIVPDLLPLGEPFSFSIAGFPLLDLPDGAATMSLQSLQTEYEIPLRCTINSTATCNSLDVLPALAEIFEVKIYLTTNEGVNSTLLLPLSNYLRFYKKPVLSKIWPPVMVQQVTKQIILSFASLLDNKNFLQLKVTPVAVGRRSGVSPVTLALISSQVENEQVTVDAASVLSANTISAPQDYLFSISVNNGHNFHDMMAARVIPSYSAIKFENPEDDNQPSAFTFKQTRISLVGDGFPTYVPLSEIMFKFVSVQGSTIVPAISGNLSVSLNSTTRISFISPLLSDIVDLADSNLRFPFSISFGISFNSGDDYEFAQDLVYLDKYREPSIINIDINVISRDKHQEVVLRGQNFLDIKECIYLITPELNVTLAAVPTESNGIVCSLLGAVVPPDVKVVTLTVKNARNQMATSKTATLFYYKPPTVVSISPETGSFVGGYDTIVGVKDFEADLVSAYAIKTYLKFGNNKPVLCELNNTNHETNITYLVCPAEASEPGQYSYSISYNYKDWYASTGTFQYEACPAGYSTSHYTKPCFPCSPGTYKPSSGNYNCVACKNGTYSDTYAALECSSCPFFTTSVSGASSKYDCGCINGYYVNPDPITIDFKSKYCVSCPVGGLCNSTNTTRPVALPGYWNSGPNYNRFYECIPSIACPGMSEENCAPGYLGARCALCKPNYYKWKKQCLSCSENATVRFALLAVFLLLVCFMLFAFTSIKVTHISSISIGFSFFQILSIFNSFNIAWPTAIENSFTAASVANFNLDFISPQCIFPGIDFITRWAITLMSPFIFMALFIALYVLAELRSLFAAKVGFKLKAKYKPYHVILVDEKLTKEDKMKKKELERQIELMQNMDESPELESLKQQLEKIINPLGERDAPWQRARVVHKLEEKGIKKYLTLLSFYIRNFVSFVLNCIIWTIQERNTREELRIVFNKCINGYLTFLSFAFVYIISNASEIFVCTYQPSAYVSTLNSSPDIICYQDRWFTMLPLTIFIYIFFGLGAVVLFTYIYFARKKISDKDFAERFRFIIKRFKKKRFYWEIIVTIRKLCISMLFSFLRPMAVIALCIGVTFFALLLHVKYIPYKRKFHNIMEYIILIATLMTLLAGLLFFAGKYPFDWAVTLLTVLTLIIIVGAAFLTLGSIVWDINTRMKKEGKKVKKLRKKWKVENKRVVFRKIALPRFLMGKNQRISFIDEENFQKDIDDTKYKFMPALFESETESSDDPLDDINEIFEDLFSVRRFKRKLFLVQRKGKRAAHKVKKTAETARKGSRRNMSLHGSLKDMLQQDIQAAENSGTDSMDSAKSTTQTETAPATPPTYQQLQSSTPSTPELAALQDKSAAKAKRFSVRRKARPKRFENDESASPRTPVHAREFDEFIETQPENHSPNKAEEDQADV